MNVCTRRLTKFSTQSLMKQHRFVVGQVSMRDIERKWKLVVVVASIKTMFEQLEILSIYGIIFTWANRNLKKRKIEYLKDFWLLTYGRKNIFVLYFCCNFILCELKLLIADFRRNLQTSNRIVLQRSSVRKGNANKLWLQVW